MDYTGKLKEALDFATEKHKGQYRKGGEEYITHPMAVCEMLANEGYDEDYLLSALFHDLLEDTDATEEEILSHGNEDVLNAVKLLTKTKGYIMAEYISAIKNDPIAKTVKIADRLHNLYCAVESTEEFRIRYIRESLEWYIDMDERILPAVIALNNSLSEPIEIDV